MLYEWYIKIRLFQICDIVKVQPGNGHNWSVRFLPSFYQIQFQMFSQKNNGIHCTFDYLDWCIGKALDSPMIITAPLLGNNFATGNRTLEKHTIRTRITRDALWIFFWRVRAPLKKIFRNDMLRTVRELQWRIAFTASGWSPNVAPGRMLNLGTKRCANISLAVCSKILIINTKIGFAKHKTRISDDVE